ncbi:MAG: tol-pal system protein YbgF [Acidobacteriota bacterium]
MVQGCATTSKLIPSPKSDEIEALKRRNVELQKQATVSKIELNRLQQENARLRAEIEASRSVPTAPPRTPEPEPIAQAPISVQPEIEEIDLEEEPIEVAPPIAPEAASPPPSTVGSTTTGERQVAAPVAATADAQQLYDEGYTLFHQGSYAAAEAKFQRFVDEHPETELADNALFWVGEARYAQGDFSSALEAFSATVERFPTGNKVADALLKAGKCLESLGDREQAVTTYREVTQRFPRTSAAAKAADRLEQLGQ